MEFMFNIWYLQKQAWSWVILWEKTRGKVRNRRWVMAADMLCWAFRNSMAIMSTGSCLWRTCCGLKNGGTWWRQATLNPMKKQVLNAALKKQLEDLKLKDLKVKNDLFMPSTELLWKLLPKKIWQNNCGIILRRGSEEMKRWNMNNFRHFGESLGEVGESIADFFNGFVSVQ